ncbi:helix-turn-helix domain-containing protein [Streptomyces sp. NPDC005551]|uniref:helix-turn-helix domain-containing protein n=1 Tax=Streptomyces sp. NPDC005551 TaxID=3364725 RepID=UPI0036C5FE24
MAGQRRAPTLRMKRFGEEMRQLRERAGVSQKDAGLAIDGNQSKMSKIENATTWPKRLEVLELLKQYGLTGEDEVAAVIRRWRQAVPTEFVTKVDLRADMREMVDLESTCVRAEMFSTMHLPGLLQIEDYAAAMIQGLEPTLASDDVKSYVDLRMQRQKILDRVDPQPPEIMCILDEGVIRRPVGGPAVMAQQLKRLLELTKRPHVTIQVVPFEQAVYPGLHGSFRTLVSEDGALDVVEVSTWHKAWYRQEPSDVAVYRKLFDDIRASALPSRQTANLINDAVRTYQRQE